LDGRLPLSLLTNDVSGRLVELGEVNP
jgi:hypothetical protein